MTATIQKANRRRTVGEIPFRSFCGGVNEGCQIESAAITDLFPHTRMRMTGGGREIVWRRAGGRSIGGAAARRSGRCGGFAVPIGTSRGRRRAADRGSPMRAGRASAWPAVRRSGATAPRGLR